MFTFLSRFRRETAVLAVLALVASVLVAVPVSAADDDPKMDYTASFDACIGGAAEDAGFTDVPEGHANAGHIDCIAYYGITKGTSATTYAPLMSVTREQMALFLTRLAGLVGIEVASDPADPGFTDTGDLSDESQAAIAQLADLGITKGTSDTTYSPADVVTRGHMALFIARLMDKMKPMADGDTMYGNTPENVKPDDMSDPKKVIKSPFGDLQTVTKETYDAITNLWELGVASGVNDTHYGPAQSITRASMAGFMAGLLDHSNARPAGVTAQVSKNTDFGEVEAVLVLSARDDSFAPKADVSVKVFTATESGGIDDDTGKCLGADDPCEWSDNEEITDAAGNNFDTIDVATDNGEGADGNMENSETWYAWMGSDDKKEFVKGESGEASVTLTAKANALGIRVTSDINKEAANNGTDPNQVDVGKDRSVVITAQLIDTETASDASKAVAKEGVSLAIARTRGATPDAPGPDAMKTDADGKVTFTIEGPPEPDEGDPDLSRDDTVTFTGDVDGDGTTDTSDVENANLVVRWRSAAAAVAEGVPDTPTYVIIDDGEVSFNVMVSYYDQYGNPAASGDRLTITVTNTDGSGDDASDTSGENGARVRNNGTVRFPANLKAAAGDSITATISALETATSIDAADATGILAVRHANKNDDGVTSTAENLTTDTDNDRFIIDGSDAATAGVLYSYDADDTFIVNDKTADMAAFEEAIEATGATVEVVLYSPDGSSIFSTG